MQKRTEELQLAIQDYFDVDWFSMKCYMRRQIAKCVNECKSQAANAKRIVGTIKHHRPKRKTTEAAAANGDWESDDDFDYWDSDFDEDFDDEPEENGQVSENHSFANQEQREQAESPASSVKEETVTSTSSQNGISPHSSPDMNNVQQAATSSPPSCNSVQTPAHRNTIQRGPIKRPASGPPPPPVPQPSNQENRETAAEEYEVPISYPLEVGSASTPCKHLFSGAVQDSSIPYKSATNSPYMVNGSEATETYEIIEPGEENYEVVQGPPIPVKPPEKPCLPPRLPQTSINAAPPPLPLKPKKLQESLSNHHLDGSRSLNRPKLPIKQQDDDFSNENSNISGLGSSIFSSILGRRNSNSSSSSLPRSNHSRDRNSSDSILSIGASNMSFDGQAAAFSPEKDGFFTVGSSAFISSSTTVGGENSKMQSPKQEESAQNMATRPLPPVPQVESRSSPIRQSPMTSFPWFHEVEREDAEHQIRNLGHSGSFLVRPSKRAGQENPYTLTVLHNGKVFHLNIRLRPDDTFALGKEKKKEKTFSAVPELIAYHQKEPILLTSRGECAGQTILGAYPEK